MTLLPAQPEIPPRAYDSTARQVERLCALLPLVVVFLCSLAHPLDPDLGWHLKYGEYFFQHHALPPGNTFSAEMADYPYVNHAWGSDVILYALFNAFGFPGISFLGAAITTLTFACFSRAGHLSFWEEAILFPPLLYVLNPILEQSFRSQMISLLGIGMLFLIAERAEKKSLSNLVMAVPLFVLWANGHGQFVVGLALLACWGGIYILRAWAAARWQRSGFPSRAFGIILATGVGSGLASLLTPHGLTIYTEIGRHAVNQLQQHVNEWQPIGLEPRLWWPFLVCGAVLSVSCVHLYRQRQIMAKAHYLVPVLLLFAASIQQRRHFWPMVLLSLPIIAPLAARLRPQRPVAATAIAVALLAGTYLYGGAVNLPRQHIFPYSWELYCRHLGCTAQSATFLQSRLAGQTLLTDYDWGGWLIWNFPDIKPTIDGRMPFWRDEHGYSAYEHYLPLENGEADIDASPYSMVYWPAKKETLFNRLSQLVKENKWQEIYADPFASIFVRNHRSPAIPAGSL